jgi:hypothetical protein
LNGAAPCTPAAGPDADALLPPPLLKQRRAAPATQVGQPAALAAAARAAATGGRVPKPDVVLTTYEAVSSDLHALRALPWSAVVLDLRQRSRSAAGKAHAALHELTAASPAQRLVLTGHRARGRGPDEAFGLAALVRPPAWEDAGEAMPEGLDDPEAQVRIWRPVCVRCECMLRAACVHGRATAGEQQIACGAWRLRKLLVPPRPRPEASRQTPPPARHTPRRPRGCRSCSRRTRCAARPPSCGRCRRRRRPRCSCPWA